MINALTTANLHKTNQIANTFKGYQNSGMSNSSLVDTFIKSKIEQSKITSTHGQSIKLAIDKLKDIKFAPTDINYIKNIGVNLIFNSGDEIIEHLNKNRINIKYGQMINDKTHAQWNNSTNTIIINDKYKNTTKPDEILAIAASIAHEAGHSVDKDNLSSIQEEIDCLAMNTIVNRAHQRIYPNVFKQSSQSDILQDGVLLYTELFFNPDKKPLEDRIKEKYGNLQLQSPNHPALALAKKIKSF